jgi:hypothetical protein
LYTYAQLDDFAGSLAMSLLRHSNSPCRWLLIVLLAVTLGSLQSVASAEPRRDKGQAAAIVQQRYGGKVMNVSTRQTGNGVVYGVKILQNSGHMRTVSVDGQTGAILN